MRTSSTTRATTALLTALAVSALLAGCANRPATTGSRTASGPNARVSSRRPMGPAPGGVVFALGPVSGPGAARLVLASVPGTAGSTIATASGVFGLSNVDQPVAISPDGARLAFTKDSNGEPPSVWIADLPTGRIERVYDGIAYSLAWGSSTLYVEQEPHARHVGIAAISPGGRQTASDYAIPAGAQAPGGGRLSLVGADEKAVYLSESAFGFESGDDVVAVWRAERATHTLTLTKQLLGEWERPIAAQQPVGVPHLAIAAPRMKPGTLSLMFTAQFVPHGEAADVTPTVVVYRLADMKQLDRYTVARPPAVPLTRGRRRSWAVIDVSADGSRYIQRRPTHGGSETSPTALYEVEGRSGAATELPLPTTVQPHYVDTRDDIVFQKWVGPARWRAYLLDRPSRRATQVLVHENKPAPRGYWQPEFFEVIGAAVRRSRVAVPSSGLGGSTGVDAPSGTSDSR